jgi:arginase
MTQRLDVIGAPSSAGAYAPGQEKAPQALRDAGLIGMLREGGVHVEDRGDVVGFRWRPDPAHPRAMNTEAVTNVARAVADRVARSRSEDAAVLVLGGDCTVELGTVAGVLAGGEDVGLIYVDLDTDLNTPQSISDGALDWMGVAHLLGLPDTIRALAEIGPRVPLLAPEQILLFGVGNSTESERRVIEEHGVSEVRLDEVAADPEGAARAVAQGWARHFARILVHIDIDVVDFLDLPIAENARRNKGLRFEQLAAASREFVAMPSWVGLTVCEVNPDHGALDGSTLAELCAGLAHVLSVRQLEPG